MVDPFGEISFLTRSENRVTVLETLADGRYTQRELVEATGISDVTVGRILDDFEDRGWTRETGEGHATTPLGDLLAEEYGGLHGAMDVACRLGPAVDLLPVGEMDFDLRHLTDARISDPEEYDALRAVDRWIELIRGADRIRVLAHSTGEVIARTLTDRLRDGDLRMEAVLRPNCLEQVSESRALREFHREMVRAGAELYRLDEAPDALYGAATFDSLAAIAGYDGSGALRVGIESRAEPVYDWVASTIERHRADATPLGAEDFPD